MNKGVSISAEAVLALMVVASLVVIAGGNQKEPFDFTELVVLQKENDLLKAWVMEKSTGKGFSLGQMEKDFIMVFPHSSGIVELNGSRVLIGAEGKTVVSSSAFFFGTGMKKDLISVAVFI